LAYLWVYIFAKNRVANHLTQGDCVAVFCFYSSQGRKPYFALIRRFKWQLNIYCPLRPYSIFILKYEAKTLQIQQFQTLILIRDRQTKVQSVLTPLQKKESFEQSISKGFRTHAIWSVSFISFGWKITNELFMK